MRDNNSYSDVVRSYVSKTSKVFMESTENIVIHTFVIVRRSKNVEKYFSYGGVQWQ